MPPIRSGIPSDQMPLVQSRETGDVIPDERTKATVIPGTKASPFAKSWVHFVAGGYVCK
jgi:solute carrier family 25, member 33/36